ncbi:sushi, von Willebrand factor type A, EGF and pentraxin domain-containing protein 1-like isoform X4 [Saccostrea cucullata]|uniref:sushi, von Willebrand factor type A, EGF and pentraxin domain-containing protein 1-like isoform X4 n=1 Tax=Saccostrea cuccullata TaxID=36930 RepID=UPI002ED4C7D7
MKIPYIGIIQTLYLVTEIFEGAEFHNCKTLVLENGSARLRIKGRIVRFRCKRGFQLYGAKVAVCRNEEWSFPAPVCVAEGEKCPNLKKTKDMMITSKLKNGLLMYSCKPGLTLTGNSTLYCDGSKWRGEIPQCICHYLFMEASRPTMPENYTTLLSPHYNPMEAGFCFEFWYHMLGRDGEENVGSLKVGIKDVNASSSNLDPVWIMSGNQGDTWHKGSLEIGTRTSRFQILITGTRGDDRRGDIAIDDVSITNCTSGKQNTYSFVCTFA